MRFIIADRDGILVIRRHKIRLHARKVPLNECRLYAVHFVIPFSFPKVQTQIAEVRSVNTREISIEAWHALTIEGIDLPVHIQLYGHSMHPLIRFRQDYVTIRPVSRSLLPGDIVLFQRGDGRYVVHRVWKLRRQTVQTLGDHCMAPDEPIPAADVLGLVTHIQRGAHTFCVDTPFWRAAGRLRSASMPLRRAARRLLRPVKQAFP